jgi:light-harvesting complex I chlorophyll a/b binding protein 4
MSRSSSTNLAIGAVGTMAVLSPVGLQTFVAPGAGAPALRGAAVSSTATGGASTVSQAGVATALATTAVAAMAMTSGRRAARKPIVACAVTATGARTEKPFAGGLIGGESAFASSDFNFDPLGLSVKCEKYLPYFRESELKHGRVAMLAWVGLVAPEFFRIPGPGPCYTAANVVEAHKACAGDPYFPFLINTDNFFGTEHQVGPLFQVYAFCGFAEMLTSFAKFCNISNKPGLTLENAGDYRLGINFLPKDELKAKEMKLKELKNGRLAMLAFGGAITQATLSGNGFPWLYASAPSSNNSSLSSSLKPASSSLAAASSSSTKPRVVARRAEEVSYKMSAAVPFLPMSPALEGYPGQEEGFDPMGFSLAIDIRWLREAELKHGRVAMLATLGWIATDCGLRVPGAPFQVSTIEAHDVLVKYGTMPHMLIWFGLAEMFGFLAFVKMSDGESDRKPGDFGLRVLYPKDEQGQYQMQLKELRNGRLAMLAYGGIVTVAVLTEGDKWPFFATAPGTKKTSSSTFCGASMSAHAASAATVRHAEHSASLPFLPKPKNLKGMVGERQEFDPLGFSDTFDVRWLRESELKHGRVCMLATLGFVSEQFFTFPDFQGSPDAVKAMYSSPPAATAVLLFIVGYIESSTYNGKITMLDMFVGEGAKRAPGDLNFGKSFLPKDDESAKSMMEKELNNGRLAMLAIAGMIHHNLVVSGPLFPLVPDGWTPEGVWKVDSWAGLLNSGRAGV